MKLIGLGGTNASGKDTVAEMLAERHGWLYVSISEMLRVELKKRGLPIERKKLRDLSAEWRREHGFGVMIDRAVEQFDKKKHKGLVISSLRNSGEADRVLELGGRVIWVDADPKIRYQRIVSRVRSDEDRMAYDEFLKDEQEEMEHFKGDKHTLNLAGVKAKADVFLENNGSDIEKFKDQAEQKLRDEKILD